LDHGGWCDKIEAHHHYFGGGSNVIVIDNPIIPDEKEIGRMAAAAQTDPASEAAPPVKDLNPMNPLGLRKAKARVKGAN
jgi:hypothetical protein